MSHFSHCSFAVISYFYTLQIVRLGQKVVDQAWKAKRKINCVLFSDRQTWLIKFLSFPTIIPAKDGAQPFADIIELKKVMLMFLFSFTCALKHNINVCVSLTFVWIYRVWMWVNLTCVYIPCVLVYHVYECNVWIYHVRKWVWIYDIF